MPRINQYQSRTSAPSMPNAPRVTGDMLSGGLGRGLMEAGNAIGNVADSWARRKKEEQDFEASKLAMKERQDITTFMEEQKKNAPAGAKGFTEKTMKELDARKEKAMENAQSDYQRQQIDLQFSNIHLTTFNEAMNYETEATAKHERNEMQSLFDQNNNDVRANPSRAAIYAQEEARMIDNAPNMDATFKEQWKIKRGQEIYASAFDGEVSRFETANNVTSGQVKAYLASAKAGDSQWVQALDPDQYQSGVKRLERLQESLQHKETTEIYAHFDEKMDQRQATGSRGTDDKYSADWIKANVSDPVKQEAMLKRLSLADTVGQAMTFVKDAPSDKVLAEIKKAEEAQKTAENFHVQNAKLQALNQAKTLRDRQFVEDPSAYVQNVSVAAQAKKAVLAEALASGSPDNIQKAATAYADFMANEQTRLYPGIIPKVLDKNETGRIAAQMSAVMRDEKGAAEVSASLQAEMDKWGHWWPHVVRDLKSDKALNDSQFVAASMLDKPQLKHLSEEILKSAAVPRKELSKRLGGDVENTTYQDAMTALGDFKKSLSGVVGGEQVVSSYAHALTQLAMYKEDRGEDVDMEDLANQIVNDSYEFSDSYRIPKTYNGVQLDTNIIGTGVGSIHDELNKVQFADLPTTTPQTGGLRSNDIATRYRKEIIRNGRIYTKSDDSGVRVTDSYDRQVYVLRDGKRVPLEYSWSELQSLGAQRKLEKSREDFHR